MSLCPLCLHTNRVLAEHCSRGEGSLSLYVWVKTWSLMQQQHCDPVTSHTHTQHHAVGFLVTSCNVIIFCQLITPSWLTLAAPPSLQVLPAEMSLEDTALFYARTGAAAYDAAIVTYKVTGAWGWVGCEGWWCLVGGKPCKADCVVLSLSKSLPFSSDCFSLCLADKILYTVLASNHCV